MLLLMDPPHTYIGKTVLVDAEAKDGPPEKIWVQVESVTDQNGDTLFHGIVLIKPQYATYLKQGGWVEFTLDEIEEVYE